MNFSLQNIRYLRILKPRLRPATHLLLSVYHHAVRYGSSAASKFPRQSTRGNPTTTGVHDHTPGYTVVIAAHPPAQIVMALVEYGSDSDSDVSMEETPGPSFNTIQPVKTPAQHPAPLSVASHPQPCKSLSQRTGIVTFAEGGT